MITGSAVYQVLEAMAPLYTAAGLGYASVRWLKAFSDEQCAGINHFVALYAVPVLIFHMVSTNNLYAMDARLIAADTLQKVVILLGLTAWALWTNSRRRDGIKAAASSPLQWVVTAFSVATLPNTIIMGVPLLNGMYGEVSTTLMKQIVVMQFCFWYNVVIFLYEYMEAMRAATVENGSSTKICPASPEKSAKVDNLVASELSDQVVMTIEITDVAVASPAQDGAVVETKTIGDVKVPSMKHVVWMAVKKILMIPNTYASILGLIWSLVAFRYGINMPKIIDDSLFTVYTTAVGLSMFSSGTFIARQSRFVPCGYTIASLSMVLKFLIGPVVMLLASLLVGMHGTLLHVAVVQQAHGKGSKTLGKAFAKRFFRRTAKKRANSHETECHIHGSRQTV